MIKNSSKIYFEKKPYGRIFFLFYFFFVVSIVVAQTTNISGRVAENGASPPTLNGLIHPVLPLNWP